MKAAMETANSLEEMERVKKTYYFLMGWDADGVPFPEKLEELGII